MKGGRDFAFLGQYPVPPPPLYSQQTVHGGWGGRADKDAWRGNRVQNPILRSSWFVERLSTGTDMRPKHYYGELPNVSLLSCLQAEKIKMTLGNTICKDGNIVGSGSMLLVDIKGDYKLLLRYMCRYSDKIIYTLT